MLFHQALLHFGDNPAGAFAFFIPGWDWRLESRERNRQKPSRKELEGCHEWLFPPQYIHLIECNGTTLTRLPFPSIGQQASTEVEEQTAALTVKLLLLNR